METKKSTCEDRLRLLYPAVDESETPLPRAWSQKDKFLFIGLSQNNLRVHYKGTGKNTNKDAASVRATHPIPAACGVYYFEVKIVSKGRDGYMGVGLSAQGVDMNRLPGWDKQSFGYHGDDGHSFSSSGTGQPYGPTFTTGDVIGCGVNLLDNSCFYTKNGQNLGIAFPNLPPNLYPTVGLQTPGEVVDANFGQQPFMFDIESMIEDLRSRTKRTIEHFPVDDAQGEFQSTLHKITLTYLLHHGYSETANAFAKSTDQSFTESLGSVHNRQRIQRSVLSGRIEEAIELTREFYPGFLERNRELLFELKCRQFVEMIVQLTPVRNSVKGSQSNENDTECMEVEESREGGLMTNSDINLQRIVDFGTELCEFEKTLKDPDGKLKRIRFEACALLAYPDPSQSPMSYLLSPSEREPVCAALNSAVLESLGQPLRPPLEVALAHCKQLVKLMAKHGLGASAFADLDSILN
ncbi:ran-binding protein 9 [Galendromus occidentalis]|uniref:Ran-binding protein 9 n=1 Tax=Galendromus occidentalis TaxID=34638 RepID=A0AAJ6QY59_9ACAR|nr:ran-binding protein 9 [Galendromus occidentalis]